MQITLTLTSLLVIADGRYYTYDEDQTSVVVGINVII